MWDGLDELLHQILMMGMELDPETLICNQLTWLIAQEDFINVCHHESLRSYTNIVHNEVSGPQTSARLGQRIPIFRFNQ
jgi:hypothetical protein